MNCFVTTRTDGSHGQEPAPAALLDVQAVAALLRCSPRTVYRLADSGKLPRPLKLGALVRWRRDEVLQWIADGCPTCRAVKDDQR